MDTKVPLLNFLLKYTKTNVTKNKYWI